MKRKSFKISLAISIHLYKKLGNLNQIKIEGFATSYFNLSLDKKLGNLNEIKIEGFAISKY